MKWRRAHKSEAGGKLHWDQALAKVRWIYHFLPWSFALEIFNNRYLRLSLVRSWSDPYEQWWCQLLFDQTGRLSNVAAHGLCWTTTKFDEPAWRMAAFNRSEPIVRIRCNLQAVLGATRREVASTPASAFIGAVSYKRQSDLLRHAQRFSDGLTKQVSSAAAELLLMKRNAFRFEREVRLLWLDRVSTETNQRYIRIDPEHDISQVMLSPYVDDGVHAALEQQWQRLSVNVPFVRSGFIACAGTSPQTNYRLTRLAADGGVRDNEAPRLKPDVDRRRRIECWPSAERTATGLGATLPRRLFGSLSAGLIGATLSA
jgi:hypothetical protein